MTQLPATPRAFARPVGHKSVFVPERPHIQVHRGLCRRHDRSDLTEKSLLRYANPVEPSSRATQFASRRSPVRSRLAPLINVLLIGTFLAPQSLVARARDQVDGRDTWLTRLQRGSGAAFRARQGRRGCGRHARTGGKAGLGCALAFAHEPAARLASRPCAQCGVARVVLAPSRLVGHRRLVGGLRCGQVWRSALRRR